MKMLRPPNTESGKAKKPVGILSSVRIRTKIFLSTAALLVSTMGIIGVYVSVRSYNTSYSLLQRIIDTDLGNSAVEISGMFQTMATQILLFSNTPKIQESLNRTIPAPRSLDYDDYLLLRRSIELFEQANSRFRIRLFLNNSRRYFHDFEKIFPDLSYLETEPASLLASEFGVRWSGSYETRNQVGQSRRVISCICPIFSPTEFGRINAIVSFDLDETLIVDSLSPLFLWEKIRYYLFDREYRLLSTNDKEIAAVGKSSGTLQTRNRLRRLEGSSGSRDRSSSGIVFSTPVSSGSFILSLDVPLTELQRQSSHLIRGLALIGVFVLTVSFSLSYLIAGNITKRLRRLAASMNTIEHNDFSEELSISGSDEVAELTRTFNHMIIRIRSLIDDVYIARIRNVKARLNLLQAQINPHFMYNTLDTINWEAKRARARSISYMIEQLSDFIRLSLNAGNEKTTIRKELHHVRAYFNIQQRRMADAIRLQMNVPNTLHRFECLNLILQPLVENAVIHGIMPKDGATGRVTLTGERLDGVVRLSVEDDGVGIKPERLDEIRALLADGSNDETGTSFGLLNVHSRIRIAYGIPFGIEIAAGARGGTRVSCSFPCDSE